MSFVVEISQVTKRAVLKFKYVSKTRSFLRTITTYPRKLLEWIYHDTFGALWLAGCGRVVIVIITPRSSEDLGRPLLLVERIGRSFEELGSFYMLVGPLAYRMVV